MRISLRTFPRKCATAFGRGIGRGWRTHWRPLLARLGPTQFIKYAQHYVALLLFFVFLLPFCCIYISSLEMIYVLAGGRRHLPAYVGGSAEAVGPGAIHMAGAVPRIRRTLVFMQT